MDRLQTEMITVNDGLSKCTLAIMAGKFYVRGFCPDNALLGL